MLTYKVLLLFYKAGSTTCFLKIAKKYIQVSDLSLPLHPESNHNLIPLKIKCKSYTKCTWHNTNHKVVLYKLCIL